MISPFRQKDNKRASSPVAMAILRFSVHLGAVGAAAPLAKPAGSR
jgi:hypothetical protein